MHEEKRQDMLFQVNQKFVEVTSQLQEETSSSKKEIKYSDKWKNRAQWRKLRIGMTMDQVRQILGEPPKVNVRSYSIIWYYPSALGGNVDFNTSTRKVDGWSEP